MKIKVGIAGGAGYTGGELLRILINHPDVEISYVHSKSNAGNYVHVAHNDLLGDTELKFASELHYNIDVLFLCLGHGDSVKFLNENQVPDTVKIIDLSQDFRPETNGFVYGLPELKRDQIKKASKIANPGCFATSIELALLPLAKANLLNNEIHISATTGSTGAGQNPSSTTHFSWRNNNLSVYKAFEHQHLKEIKQSVKQLMPNFDAEINFIPNRGAFPRGILATLYTNSSLSIEEANKIYTEYYEAHPFVTISNQNIDLKQVVNTNKCIIYLEKHGNKLMIISMIDNLTKGASGQAVQNMNLIFGLDETKGLRLKSVGF
jgi:N-acetyl-gamma-glutamyl-phosphate reductase